MTNRFTAEFWGLCAYLLHGKDKNAAVLFVEHPHHPHVPKLKVDFGNLTNKDDAKRFPTNNGLVGWLDFSGYDIRVKPDGTAAKLSQLNPKNAAGQKKGCPKSGDKEDFAWLPDLNHLGGKASRNDLITPLLPTNVVGRFHLTEGDLQCAAHARESGITRKYEFGGEEPTAIASAALYQLKTSGSTAMLSFEKNGEVDFEISLNLPADVQVTHLPDLGSTSTVQHHFDAFYNLLLAGATKRSLNDTGPCPGMGMENEPFRPCPQTMLRMA